MKNDVLARILINLSERFLEKNYSIIIDVKKDKTELHKGSRFIRYTLHILNKLLVWLYIP